MGLRRGWELCERWWKQLGQQSEMGGVLQQVVRMGFGFVALEVGEDWLEVKFLAL